MISNSITHLELQWRSIAWRPWLEALSDGHTLIRYDPRGCGLSERNIDGLSFETCVRDAEGVAKAAGLETFPLIGVWQGGAVAVALAQRAPERVERLVLYGAYARGRHRRHSVPLDRERARLILEMLRIGWDDTDRGFMRSLATQVQPQGSIEHLDSWCELQRRATSSETAVALTRVMFDIDVQEEARDIRCPTLVAHADRDAVVPLSEGRLLARLIPQVQFLELESSNHFMLPQEPAWHQFCEALNDFLSPPVRSDGAFGALTPREREVLGLLAHGLDNAHIAAALGISAKTVRNHMLALLDKLNVATRGEAIVAAREAGLGRAPTGTSVPVSSRH